MDLKKELAKYRDRMWERAQILFVDQKKKSSGMGIFVQDLLDDLHDSIQGGKAVRGALVCHGALSCGGDVTDDIIDLALAMEMFHTFLLIHDDIIDHDEIRRGKSAFHVRYRTLDSKLYKVKDPHHFGISVGIMGGDMLSSLAYQLICKTGVPDLLKINIIQMVSETMFDTGAGEILDVLNDMRIKHNREHLMKVHTLKTARYTFCNPLTIGATAVGATKEQHTILKNYALPIGLAFQLHDDLLGLFGEASKLGKPIFSDLREGKQTLLIIEAYERASLDQKNIIDKALGNTEITVMQGEKVKQVVKETGAHDYSILLAKTFKTEAVKHLQNDHLSKESKEFFNTLAEYIVNREY